MRRVVITGMGALTPIGNSAPIFIENAMEGKNGVGPITAFDASVFKTQFACEVKGFDAKAHFDRKTIKKYDRFTQYALVAVKEAVNDIDFATLNTDRIGVIWGSGEGGIQTLEDQIMGYGENKDSPRFSPFYIPRLLINMAAGIISLEYGLHGVNYAPNSACATSTTAIIDAFNYVRWNKADMIISGGSEAPITPSNIGGFGSMKALSTRNDDFLTASRPFDINRDGFVMGEGAGAIVVEELEHARKRGATILAEIVGGGMAADAYHLTGTHPKGAGAIKGMKLALEEANINPNKVDYVNLHATSTPNGDISEINAINTLFQDNASLHVSGTKSMTGHLLGAAGAVEAILCVGSLQKQMVPPTINVENFEEACTTFNYPTQKGVKTSIRYAMSNTFGFGGHIATLLMKKYEEE